MINDISQKRYGMKEFRRGVSIFALVAVLGSTAMPVHAGFFGPDYPRKGGSWTLPDVSEAELAAIRAMSTGSETTNIGENAAPVSEERLKEIFGQNPCLDPAEQVARTTSGHAWIYGRTPPEDTDGECHSVHVRIPSEQRPDGLIFAVVIAHGDNKPKKWTKETIPDYPGLYVFEAPRPGYGREIDDSPKYYTSGKKGGSKSKRDGSSIANRTPDKVDSYTGLVSTSKELYGIDAVIGWGESGGINILSNVPNLDGLFAWGTTCDDQKWLKKFGTKARAYLYKSNVDMLDGMEKWHTDYPVMIVNGSRDRTTSPRYGKMCHNAAKEKGLTNVHFVSPDGLGHNNKPKYKKFEENKDKLRKAFRVVFDKVIEQTIARKVTEADQ